jgi:hypothetical protein
MESPLPVARGAGVVIAALMTKGGLTCDIAVGTFARLVGAIVVRIVAPWELVFEHRCISVVCHSSNPKEMPRHPIS